MILNTDTNANAKSKEFFNWRAHILGSGFFAVAVAVAVAVAGSLMAPRVQASEIVKVNKKKGLVIINEGSDAGLAVGAKVCFRSKGKKTGKKIACAIVRKLKPTSALLQVRNKQRGKMLRKGLSGTVEGSGGSLSVRAPGGKFMAIRVLGLPGIVTQARFNKIQYVASGEGKAVQTMWSPGEVNSQATISGGLEFSFFRINMAVGIRALRQYRSFEIDSNYSTTDPAIFVTATTKATAIGGYLDYFFLTHRALKSGLRVGAGLDLDYSTVLLSAVQAEDSTDTRNPLYDVKSTLLVVSLRAPVVFDVALGAFGLNFGLNLIVPVYAPAAVLLAENSDDNISNYEGADEGEKQVNASIDMAKSLGHIKSSFAAELVAGVSYAF